MQTYLEIKVPIRENAKWFEQLRNACRHIPVIWQNAHYHITIAFCDETPENFDIKTILTKHLGNACSQELCFDKLEAFAGKSGTLIIYLGVSNVPLTFTKLVESIRQDLIAAGCVVSSNFVLHVTLGRIFDKSADLQKIKDVMKSVAIPPFSLKLRDVAFRKLRGNIIYEKKLKAACKDN